MVPLSGFYEWKDDSTQPGKNTRQPHYIYRGAYPATTPLLVAGLYDDVTTGGPNPTEFRTFSVLTTLASTTVADVHVRMPVLLTSAADVAAWLQGGGDSAMVSRLARTAREVCTR